MKTRQCILVVWIRCTAIWVEENITTPPAASKDSSAKGGEEEEEEEASFSDAVGGGGGGGRVAAGAGCLNPPPPSPPLVADLDRRDRLALLRAALGEFLLELADDRFAERVDELLVRRHVVGIDPTLGLVDAKS
jgi:hypothetical protein